MSATADRDAASRAPDPGRRQRAVDVLVVGAGPAGLAAAGRLAASGAGTVEVVDREDQAGGIPRHCFHTGFGVRDLRRPMSGPAYARHWRDLAIDAGATLRTGVSVTGWAGRHGRAVTPGGPGPLTVETTGPEGLESLSAGAVVLATGARERPRGARLVPGTRPAGVFTTGELQQAVHLHHQWIGARAVVIGAEPVGYSAVRTLRGAGVEIAAMVTEQPHHQSSWVSGLGARLRHRVPLLTATTVTELLGRGRLTGVALRHDDGRTTTIGCDTVVFTGDWIPDHELARRGGIALDRGTRGPAVDTAFRTAAPGVFAVGNLLHAIEPAGTAAREGRLVAGPVLRFLADGAWPGGQVPVEVDAPLRWVAPNRIDPRGPRPPLGRFTLRTARSADRLSFLVVTQDGRVLHRERLRRGAVPNRPLYACADWIDRADPGGGPIVISAG
ncbi:NAD(P)/FAD-dependent oxidoreductase [Streptomyces sp. 35G-GA-8]|uniref:NAD(P)/FAD-dependent oxidoreductase n=1 Tax=Streptomyces sp. 35G-GA-8 TaxID=2939434 RepID=UPI00201FACE6|nr:FAD-dependent oxidoreductase [Streptomyces sp. 35G-GA-8]MCL7377978.1 NAD(P)/FAD-dependent oxidoreductase [Streptomyces sp. 35G-GA-8]